MTKHSMRGLALVAASGLGLWLGGAAQADQGTATLDAKSEGSVTMNALTYRVNASTVLESKDGNRIAFADLPTIAEGASADAAAVWFEADDNPTAPVLYRLKLTGAVPE